MTNEKDEELEDLRNIVASQLHQLYEQEEELRHFRQQTAATTSASSRNFHAHSSSNPYQDHADDASSLMIHHTLSRICEWLSLVGGSGGNTFRRSPTGGRRSFGSSLSLKARFIHTLNAVIMCILVLHFCYFHVLKGSVGGEPSSTSFLDTASATSKTQESIYPLASSVPINKLRTADVKPWTSTPPAPIRLMDTNDPKIKQRHQCIKAIRKKQLDFFQDFFQGNQLNTLLVDPAYHSNVGDVMLTMGELELIQGTMKREAPTQCHYIQANNFYPLCEQVIPESAGSTSTNLGLWHAGGNWGDLWRDAQDVRIPSLQTLLENNFIVISMPQSLFYQDQSLKKKDIASLRTKIAFGLGIDDPSRLDEAKKQQLAHSRVILTWREKESYEEAITLYPFVRNVLLPDIAFQIGPFAPIRKAPEKMVDILMFMRNDKESKVSTKRNDNFIRDMLPNKDMTFRIVDWPDRLEIFHTQDYLFTESSIELLSLGKVVICDRLHAAILSYLAGIPFVYIDQISGKISKTLGAAFSDRKDCMDGSKANWARASDLQDAINKAASIVASITQ